MDRDPRHYRGTASEFAAASWFTANGYELFWPVGNSSCAVDFIATRGGITFRVQVKTGSPWNRGTTSYLSVSIGRKGTRKQYRKHDLDWLVVVSPSGWIMAVPFHEIPKNRSCFHIRLAANGRPEQEKWNKWVLT